MSNKTRFCVVAALALTLLILAATGATAGKWGSSTSSVLDDARLRVTFAEKGLGKAPVSFQLHAGFYINWTCDGVWAGDTGGGGPSWNYAQQSTTVTPTKGTVQGALTHPIVSVDSAGWLKCPDGSPAFLADIAWTNITVTDLSSNKVLQVSSVSRTFS
jgi:hypothetical protein